ncbi:SufE family protein [Pseudomonas sp. ABC1]|uniref:SufE family protein n=1 Tax=Pseudomonas sp. ABC1 TaxID=2748080 RepID=UPI0015C2D147|nr:SufE family protein [Pseudomonas sp. ABC1]QLF92175.1 SufE family protein [Pseudomonas sp. ABC1]
MSALPDSAQEALAAFSTCKGWEDHARLLMKWGAKLEPLKPFERCESNRIQGCESQVWLVAERPNGNWHFRADSEARLLRGLLALLLARIQGLDAMALDTLDLVDWFQQLGLSRQLSPSRSNGMNAVLQRIQAINHEHLQ